MILNKNRIFILLLTTLSGLTIFFSLSFFAKYKLETQEQNVRQYKKISNSVVSLKALEDILKEDIKAKKEEKDLNFVLLLSLLAAKYYGNWDQYSKKDLKEIVLKLQNGQKNDLQKFYPNYDYFEDFYKAVFCEFVGDYKISNNLTKNEKTYFKQKYGLKAYSPIAFGFKANFCDDFDNEINFAKQKGHFGNDIAAKKLTPFVAVESGIISDLVQTEKENKIELKSFDGKRCYIYSNCDKQKPFAKKIKKGSVVFGGQILGFVGEQNSCKKGGAKILKCPYLHFAIKLNFKNKQKQDVEIYIDPYKILKFLENHKSEVYKKDGEYFQKHLFRDEVFLKNS